MSGDLQHETHLCRSECDIARFGEHLRDESRISSHALMFACGVFSHPQDGRFVRFVVVHSLKQ